MYVLPTIESHAKKKYAHIIEQAQSDYLILQFHTYKIFLKSEQGIVAENSKRSK